MPARACREAAEDVAAADDDAGLDAELLDFADVLGDLRGHGGIDAELLLAHQSFAGEFQKDALVGGRHICGIISIARAVGGECAPGAKFRRSPASSTRRLENELENPNPPNLNVELCRLADLEPRKPGNRDVLAHLGDRRLRRAARS